MDPMDNFAQKKKKDLVAISTLFGLLPEEKANRMTRQELIDLLIEKERMSRSASDPVTSDAEMLAPETSREAEPIVTQPVTDASDAPKDKDNKTTTKRRSHSGSGSRQERETIEIPPVADKALLITDPIPLETVLPAVVIEAPVVDVTTASSDAVGTSLQEGTTPARKKIDKGSRPRKESQAIPVSADPAEKMTAKKSAVNPSSNRKKSKADADSRSPVSESGNSGTPEQEAVVSETRVVLEVVPVSTTVSEVVPQTPVVTEGVSEPGARHGEHNRTKRRSVIIVPKEERFSEAKPVVPETSNDLVFDADSSANETPSNEPVTHPGKSHKPKEPTLELLTGVLEIVQDGSYGFLRRENYLQGLNDVYVASNYLRRFNLRVGDLVTGYCRPKRDNDRYPAIQFIKEVNGEAPEKMIRRATFDRLTPIYPDQKYTLETEKNELSTRIIDLVAPIGKGQRGMIVSPPKAGKTILLQKIANAISINNPDSKLIVLLIDERPEEVTDMQRSINGEVVYSTFDKTPENHCKITELVLERAMRLVELGQDVVILLDSITRLSRAYNLTINPTGRTLSGGLDPGALYGPKRFFGAARNIENGGSLTIIATSLIDTGSRMDEVIFEEFKGTGNMEVYLDRKLSEKRIFPAIDINKSGTRREELLLSTLELDAVWTIRKAFGQLDTAAVTEMIISLLLKTTGNQQFVQSVNVSFNDKATFEAMRGTRLGGNGTPGGSGQGAK